MTPTDEAPISANPEAKAGSAPDVTTAWVYPVLSARDEAIQLMAQAMRRGPPWPVVFRPGTAEALAEAALTALEKRAGGSLQNLQTTPAPEALTELIGRLREVSGDPDFAGDEALQWQAADVIEHQLAALAEATEALTAFVEAGAPGLRQGKVRFSAWSLDRLGRAFDQAVAFLHRGTGE